MNVDELLSFDSEKSKLSGKTKLENDGQANSKKKQKTENLEGLSEQQKLEILKLLENDTEAEPFNESILKKLLGKFEKRVLKNQEMRIKFPELPEKFMDSEIELNDVIQELHVVSTRPDLFPILLESNFVGQLLCLLGHENIDISSAVIQLLQELTDLESESSIESVENVKKFVDVLIENQIISLLVSNLERLDEKNKDEAESVSNVLGIVENIIEVKPTFNLDSTKQALLQWLLKRIKVKGLFDSNKLYAAELISMLVQNQDENRKLLGDLDGIDILLRQIAYYKKHKPSSAEEFEYMENLFDCLCSCLMISANRVKFLKGEGLQLMRLILKEQKVARNSALKVLSYAMNNLDGKENCQAFVETLGLGILFPLFMKPSITTKKKSKESLNNEEHIVSIITSLLKNCNAPNKERVIAKFIENDHEKVDRLLELYFKYSEQVNQVDSDDIDEDVEDKDEEIYMKKLEYGLFALQSIVFIILDITVNGPSTIRKRVEKLLNLRRIQKDKLVQIIRDYEDNLGDSDDVKSSTDIQEEKKRISELIEKF